MSNLCSDSVLTGQEGTILFTPPGTSACLRDYSPFLTTSNRIYLPCGSSFIVGDTVVFTEEDGGSIDTGITAGTDYVIATVGVGASSDTDASGADMEGVPFITLTGVTIAGDGGTGSADTALPAHINVALSAYQSVCGVRDFSIDISRDELDVTTLPCAEDTAKGCENLAEFRKTQAGYANATGSMTVYFTCDQSNISNRLLSSSVLKSQTGAKVKLYVCATYEGGALVDSKSLYVEAEISITGLSFSVNPEDATSAELSFGVRKMTSMFGLT